MADSLTHIDWPRPILTPADILALHECERRYRFEMGLETRRSPFKHPPAMSKPMRAKMRVTSITKNNYSEIVAFTAVYGGNSNAEDNTYASATPSGSISLQIDNKALHGIYQPDDTFYVDFTPIPKT